MSKAMDKCQHGHRPYIDSGYCAKCHPGKKIKELELEILSLRLSALTPSAELLDAFDTIKALSHDLDIAVMALKAIAACEEASSEPAKRTIDMLITRRD